MFAINVCLVRSMVKKLTFTTELTLLQLLPCSITNWVSSLKMRDEACRNPPGAVTAPAPGREGRSSPPSGSIPGFKAETLRTPAWEKAALWLAACGKQGGCSLQDDVDRKNSRELNALQFT